MERRDVVMSLSQDLPSARTVISPRSTLFLFSPHNHTASEMPGFGISIITEDGLREFHRKHFPGTKTPDGPLLAKNEAVEEEVDLGFYPDGTKRTLTDEQIAMFRHSEVQKMIRRVREAADSGTLQSQVERLIKSESASPTLLDDLVNSQSDEDKSVPKKKKRKTFDKRPVKRKRSFKFQARAIKKLRHDDYQPINGIRHDPGEYMDEDGDRTFRRQCREADEVKMESVELDY